MVTALYGAVWFAQQRWNIGWDGWGQLIQFGLTLVLLREARADGAATQAKLDEIIHAQTGARADLERIEDQDEASIEAVRLGNRQ